MNSKIAETLKLMCDKDNPQDKKILLLAELVEHKCDALAGKQNRLQESLDATNAKLDKLTQLLEVYETFSRECPVNKHKEGYEKLTFYVRNPKLTILIVVGLLALLCGFFNSAITEILRNFIGV